MRVCVKFSREGFGKYLAHLDMQRLFVRAIKRAELPAKYSEGFNPHMNISFAYPLGVGVETLGDYLEFFTVEPMEIQAAEQALRLQMPEGFGIVAMGELPETAGKLMALTQQAEYRMEALPPQFMEWMRAFLQKEHFCILRERKGKQREVDLRPLVRECEFLSEESLRLRVDNSGSASLNPKWLLKAAADAYACEVQARVIRLELYTEQKNSVVPLQALFV